MNVWIARDTDGRLSAWEKAPPTCREGIWNHNLDKDAKFIGAGKKVKKLFQSEFENVEPGHMIKCRISSIVLIDDVEEVEL